jgi:hypothetical protein
LRPLSKESEFIEKRFATENSEKETYICIRFKINEAFKEAGLLVDIYKRSLT